MTDRPDSDGWAGVPPDPFDTDDTLRDLVAEGSVLRDGLNDAVDRGQVINVIWSMDIGDLRLLALASVLQDRFREHLDGGAQTER